MVSPTFENYTLLKNAIERKFKDLKQGILVFNIFCKLLFISKELKDLDFSNEETISKAVNEVLSNHKLMACNIIMTIWKDQNTDVVYDPDLVKACDMYYESNPISGEKLLSMQQTELNTVLKEITLLIKENTETMEREYALIKERHQKIDNLKREAQLFYRFHRLHEKYKCSHVGCRCQCNCEHCKNCIHKQNK